MTGRSMVRALVALALVVGALAASAPAALAVQTFTLSGTFSNPVGTTYEGSVDVTNSSGKHVGNSLLDHDGSYSLQIAAGTYTVSYSVTTASPATVGLIAEFGLVKHDVEISGDTVLDVAARAQQYTVHLVGPDGSPRGANVQTYCNQQRDDDGNSHGDSAGGLNGATGDVHVWVLPPSADDGPAVCDLYIIPFDGSLQLEQNLEITSTADTEITRLIPDPVTVSGDLETSEGPATTTGITITDSDGLQVVQDITDDSSDGHYSSRVAPGTYRVQLRAITAHEDLTLEKTGVVFEAGVDRVIDGSLDTVPVKVHLVGTDGEPVPGSVKLYCGRQRLDQSFNEASLESWSSGTGEITLRGIPTQPGSDTQPIAVCNLVNDTEGGVDIQNPEIFVRPAGAELNYVVPTGRLVDLDPGDEDGVPDITESYGPHQGDGNNDGIQDYDQANVTSIPANGSPDHYGTFVTVAGPAGSTLANVATMDPSTASTPPPNGATLPSGLASFVLKGITSGSDQTVSIYGGPTDGVNGYAKYDAGSGTWSMLPANRVHVLADHVDVTLTDGGVGDDDGVANGQISDPGGMAIVPVTGDTTPPVVTGSPTTSPNGNGWYHGNVRIDWSATDPGSGVRTQPVDTVVTTQGGAVSARSPRVCDKAPTPNCTRGSVTGLKIDKAAPAVSVTGVTDGATYTLGAAATPGCTASDSLSGLSGACHGVRTGGNANGVGLFTYAASAVDQAGNTRVVKASYRVAYRFDGFLPPLNDPASPVSVFKAGSIVPVAITVRRADGQVVTPVSKPSWVVPVRGARTSSPVNEAVTTGAGTSGSSFVWQNGHWQYLWSTKGLAAGRLYRIGVRLDDGTTHYLAVGLH
jgi:hypothetical protein